MERVEAAGIGIKLVLCTIFLPVAPNTVVKVLLKAPYCTVFRKSRCLLKVSLNQGLML